ncbi:hypothetical protein PG994_003573 [Apiospora phragmitis]|uniref:2EXR domain-containing protein n=1 Tax=Apiospora phragmitis TaxID=2905665 RepID=A0ABR1VYG1_9PEZI
MAAHQILSFFHPTVDWPPALTQSAVASTPGPSLLKLPLELRNEIWCLVVRRKRPVHLRRPSYMSAWASSEPIRIEASKPTTLRTFLRSPPTTNAGSNAIFLVNRQTHAEAFAVFFSDNSFLATHDMEAWTPSTSRKGWDYADTNYFIEHVLAGVEAYAGRHTRSRLAGGTQGRGQVARYVEGIGIDRTEHALSAEEGND